jgi:putative peptidoglycan lipid II flippase
VSEPAPAEAGLLRTTAAISAWNLVSRVTGFVRVLAVGAAVGTTFLGNTYQSANLVSNILFELLAAGALSSVLVPTFVAQLGQPGGRDETARLAGAVLGVVLAVLGPIVVAGMVAGDWVMQLVTLAVADESVRSLEVELGTFFLWFFLPQVLLYAAGAVATGLLHADGRFLWAAAAPVANNVVVTLTMGAFWALRSGDEPGLVLPAGQKLLLAVGTTGGVLAMTLVPLVAVWCSGLRVRPRWEPSHPALRAMARQGLWAAAFLALTQLFLAVTIVLANRVEGGVVAFHIAFTFFLLPYALGGQPILTALYPRLAGDALAAAWGSFARRLGEGLRLLVVLIVPASVLLAGLARPVIDVLAVGALAGSESLVARVLVAYALGLLGYSAFQLLTRASYAAGDTRSPSLVNLVVTMIGCLVMVWWSGTTTGDDRVVVLGFVHSLVQVAGALALFGILRARLPVPIPLTRWPRPPAPA